MKQFTIPTNVELDVLRLGEILQEFQSGVLPVLKTRYNDYCGKQQIKNGYVDESGYIVRPKNMIVTNYCRNIVDTYEGYALGHPVEITFPDEDQVAADELTDVLNYNDVDDENAELFRQGLIYGRGAEICYIDSDGKKRFRTLNPQTIIPIYDDTLDQTLQYVVRFWQVDVAGQFNDIKYFVEVYDDKYKTLYTSSAGFASFSFVGKEPHYFDQVPITIFQLNTEEDNIFDCIIDLQNAYNTLFSSSVDDWESFCEAYLVLKGALADEDDLKKMRESRCLILDTDSSAEFLTKDTNRTEIQNLLQRTEDKIREIAAAPNFADKNSFGTSSGVALRYKIMGLENRTASILNNFKKAIQRRIELLSYMIGVINGENVELWRDCDIIFTRNLPTDLSENSQIATQLRGLVSDRTLLSILPFIRDVDKELDLVAEQDKKKADDYTTLMRIDENIQV